MPSMLLRPATSSTGKPFGRCRRSLGALPGSVGPAQGSSAYEHVPATALRRLHPQVHRRGLEQEFNSLDAQREACVAYIASQMGVGWALIPDRYDDGGISGGTMDRPAPQRLLHDIRDRRLTSWWSIRSIG